MPVEVPNMYEKKGEFLIFSKLNISKKITIISIKTKMAIQILIQLL